MGFRRPNSYLFLRNIYIASTLASDASVPAPPEIQHDMNWTLECLQNLFEKPGLEVGALIRLNYTRKAERGKESS